MIDTNSLLGFAFSILTTFTNAVHIAPATVPTSTNDLATFSLWQNPADPTALYLKDKRGGEFWICGGVVRMYYSPRMYWGLQSAKLLPTFLGPATLSSNQVVALATQTLGRLLSPGDPLHEVSPTVTAAGLYQGNRIPYYLVSWCRTNSLPLAEPIRLAEMQVDARNGSIVALAAFDEAFADAVLARRIREQVYTPDPPTPVPPRKRVRPRPNTNEVVLAIGNWLHVCQKLGVDPGGQTNLPDVNWEETYIMRDVRFSPAKARLRVAFANGTALQSIDGHTLSHQSADVYFPDRTTPWQELVGTIKYRWEVLAADFERRLRTELHVPEDLLARYRPVFAEPMEWPVGSEHVTRGLVEWMASLPAKAYVHPEEVPIAFAAEFDLHTGQVKMFCSCGEADRVFMRCQEEVFGKPAVKSPKDNP